jgi:hypothetical protein
MNLEAKAVLKPPHSTRLRDCRRAFDFAQRLDCGAFTAAFGKQEGCLWQRSSRSSSTALEVIQFLPPNPSPRIKNQTALHE